MEKIPKDAAIREGSEALSLPELPIQTQHLREGVKKDLPDSSARDTKTPDGEDAILFSHQKPGGMEETVIVRKSSSEGKLVWESSHPRNDEGLENVVKSNLESL